MYTWSRELRKCLIRRYKKIGQAAAIICEAEADKCVLIACILYMTSSFYTLLLSNPNLFILAPPYSAHPSWVCTTRLIPTALPVQDPPLIYSLISCKVQVDLPGSSTCTFVVAYQLIWLGSFVSCLCPHVCFVRSVPLCILFLVTPCPP